ncbi:MAG: hypothetical protein AAFO95_12750, partial [Cyanobacteria bacterium J06600_6]
MSKRVRVKQRFTNSILWQDNRFYGWAEDNKLEQMFQVYLETYPEDLNELETLSVTDEPRYAEIFLVKLCLKDWVRKKQNIFVHHTKLSLEDGSSGNEIGEQKQNIFLDLGAESKKFVSHDLVKQFVSHNLEAYLQEVLYNLGNILNYQYKEHSIFKS